MNIKQRREILMSTFAIYADKPFCSDYWDDHFFACELTREELIAEWATLLWTNLSCEEIEPKYGFTILEDGRNLSAGTKPYQLLFDEAIVMARKLKEQRDEAEQKRLAEARAKENERRKEDRRKQYEALKKEFGE